MKLVDDIIEMASDGKRPLADALRKCLVLAFELKNEKLKNWADKELNGFEEDEEVPVTTEGEICTPKAIALAGKLSCLSFAVIRPA